MRPAKKTSIVFSAEGGEATSPFGRAQREPERNRTQLCDALAVALDAAKSRRRDTPMRGPRKHLPMVHRQLALEVKRRLVEQEQVAALDPDRILEVENRERRRAAPAQQLGAQSAEHGKIATQHAAAEQCAPKPRGRTRARKREHGRR